MKDRRVYGDGRVYQQKGSPYWWISYYVDGKEYRESSKERDKDKALLKLREKMKEVHATQVDGRPFIGPQAKKIKVSELIEALRAHQLRNGRGEHRSELRVLQKRWESARQ